LFLVALPDFTLSSSPVCQQTGKKKPRLGIAGGAPQEAKI
jgi:hypothetical protein